MTSFNPNEFQSNENFFRVAIKQVEMEGERNFIFCGCSTISQQADE